MTEFRNVSLTHAQIENFFKRNPAPKNIDEVKKLIDECFIREDIRQSKESFSKQLDIAELAINCIKPCKEAQYIIDNLHEALIKAKNDLKNL